MTDADEADFACDAGTGSVAVSEAVATPRTVSCQEGRAPKAVSRAVRSVAALMSAPGATQRTGRRARAGSGHVCAKVSKGPLGRLAYVSSAA